MMTGVELGGEGNFIRFNVTETVRNMYLLRRRCMTSCFATFINNISSKNALIARITVEGSGDASEREDTVKNFE